jgi:hypothetical protein
LIAESQLSLSRILFLAEPGEFTLDNHVDMIENWICIEDDKEIINATCDDEIEALESIANVGY